LYSRVTEQTIPVEYYTMSYLGATKSIETQHLHHVLFFIFSLFLSLRALPLCSIPALPLGLLRFGLVIVGMLSCNVFRD
jgi:hypothetical protein